MLESRLFACAAGSTARYLNARKLSRWLAKFVSGNRAPTGDNCESFRMPWWVERAAAVLL